MALIRKISAGLILFICIGQMATAQTKPITLEQKFQHPPADAKSWVFWYWMKAAVSKEGISADLQAMKDIGIRGAYLMPIKDTSSPLLYNPATRQLSREWWDMLRYTMKEAKRLDLQLAMHVSDGFALAGGPWIKPEMSMQKLSGPKPGYMVLLKISLCHNPKPTNPITRTLQSMPIPIKRGCMLPHNSSSRKSPQATEPMQIFW